MLAQQWCDMQREGWVLRQGCSPKITLGGWNPGSLSLSKGCRWVLICACAVCADLDVLYWKQQKERLAAQRKLQSRMVSICRKGWGYGGKHAG